MKKISLFAKIFGRFYKIIKTSDLKDDEVIIIGHKIYIGERNDKKC